MTRKIGRFDIRRELGRGAQSIVYLAWDPQLEREVAVKTLHFSATERRDNAALLAEARAVSRLRHPGIVPVFEAGEEAGDVYLVFEYVPGDNLGTHLQQRGPLPAADAARLCIDILTALSTAPRRRHRPSRPQTSNVLIDVDNRSRGSWTSASRNAWTPTPPAPRCRARPATWRPVHPQPPGRAVNDVFAAGVMLMEMISGRRVMRERDPQRALQLAATVPVTLPKDAPDVDEALAAIALRAAALDPAARFQSAEDFRVALDAWLNPQEAPSAPAGSGAVDFLLRRMRHRGDFPALSESVAAINRIASSEAENIDTLSNLVLRDFSLTNKLLRLVNSVHYRPASGRISTVSRALVVLGFDTVRNIAITVLLFEHLQNKSHAALLREEFLRACLAGLFARDLAKHMKTRELEQAYICSIFHSLGRLLCQYYFPEESEDIRRVMTQHDYREDVAAQRVLGVSFEDLGIGLARSWGFPQVILESMRKLPAGAVRRPATQEDRLRALSAVANEYCDAVAHLAPAERDKAMKAIAGRFADAVPVELKAVRELMQAAVQEIENFAQIIKINLRQTRIGRNLASFDSEETLIHPHATTETQMPSEAVLEQKSVAEAALAGEKPADPQAVLSSGIQDISNTLVEDFKLNDVLRIILETMYRAMGFKRVLLCVRDARSNEMTGRFGFGPGATELARHLRFSLSAHPDNVFNVATAKGVDILIEDIDETKIAARIPPGTGETCLAHLRAVPLMIKAGRWDDLRRRTMPADRDQRAELALLRTLRNQAVMAIKQAG